MLYIGIDLGTSAVKLLLMDESGAIHKVVSREYPLEFPRPGWSQQNPGDWKTAVLEGVAFAIRDSFEVAKQLGLSIPSTKICVGGAKSPLWKKIFANVLNMDLEAVASEQGPGLGGAMLAMVACGAYETVQYACDALVQVTEVTHPNPVLAEKYEAKYQQFRKIYPACKQVYPTAVTPKAPLCKGGWAGEADWGIDNPSVQNQGFWTPPLTQGRLGGCAAPTK